MDLDLVYTFVAFIKRSFWILNTIENFLHLNDLSHGRFHMLIEIMRWERDGGIHPAELARMYGAKSATVTGLLDNLERDGLIERIPNPDDRRKVDIRLTGKGREFMMDFLPRYHEMMESAFSGISPDERTKLIDLMSTVFHGIQGHVQQYLQSNNREGSNSSKIGGKKKRSGK